jgi:hypothetical protein
MPKGKKKKINYEEMKKLLKATRILKHADKIHKDPQSRQYARHALGKWIKNKKLKATDKIPFV